MAFQPENVSTKLAKLDATQDSICTVSDYCRFFVHEAHKVVALWEKDFEGAPDVEKRLALLYLANDILQNSRKRGTQFVQPFYRVLPRAVKQTLKQGNPKVQKAVKRLVNIWEERRVFVGLSMRGFHSNDAAGSQQSREARGDTFQQVQESYIAMSAASASADALGESCQRHMSQESGSVSDAGSARQALEQHLQALQEMQLHRTALLQLVQEFIAQQEAAQAQAEALQQGQQARLQGLPSQGTGTPTGAPAEDDDMEEAYSPSATDHDTRGPQSLPDQPESPDPPPPEPVPSRPSAGKGPSAAPPGPSATPPLAPSTAPSPPAFPPIPPSPVQQPQQQQQQQPQLGLSARSSSDPRMASQPDGGHPQQQQQQQQQQRLSPWPPQSAPAVGSTHMQHQPVHHHHSAPMHSGPLPMSHLQPPQAHMHQGHFQSAPMQSGPMQPGPLHFQQHGGLHQHPGYSPQPPKYSPQPQAPMPGMQPAPAASSGILGLGPSAGLRRDPRSQMMAQPPAPPSNPPPALQPRQPLQQPQAQDLSFAGDMDGLDDGPPDFLQEPAALPDAQSMSEAEAAEFARQLAASGLNPDTLAGVLAGLT